MYKYAIFNNVANYLGQKTVLLLVVLMRSRIGRKIFWETLRALIAVEGHGRTLRRPRGPSTTKSFVQQRIRQSKRRTWYVAC